MFMQCVQCIFAVSVVSSTRVRIEANKKSYRINSLQGNRAAATQKDEVQSAF